MTQWNHELVARIAAEVRRCRDERKLSAAKLSDRTDELGMRITRTVIADLENGRKKTLDISELVILARALNVPPVQLIYPDLPDGEVEVSPDDNLRSISALQWFSGERAEPNDAVDGYVGGGKESSNYTVYLARMLQYTTVDLIRSRKFLRSELDRPLHNPDEDELSSLQRMVDVSRGQLVRIASLIIASGGTIDLDRLPADAREAIKAGDGQG